MQILCIFIRIITTIYCGVLVKYGRKTLYIVCPKINLKSFFDVEYGYFIKCLKSQNTALYRHIRIGYTMMWFLLDVVIIR